MVTIVLRSEAVFVVVGVGSAVVVICVAAAVYHSLRRRRKNRNDRIGNGDANRGELLWYITVVVITFGGYNRHSSYRASAAGGVQEASSA